MLQTFNLSKEQPSSHLQIALIDGDSHLRCRLMGLGLGVGKDIGLIRNRRGDIVISNGNTRISLGQSIACKIKVFKETI